MMSLSEFQGATTGSFVEKKISSQSWADVMDGGTGESAYCS